jgi:hypothetical protein
MKNKKILIAVVALVALIAVMAGIWWGTNMFAKGGVESAGEGEKTITVEVVHSDGSTKTFTYHTNVEYLGTVLYGAELIKAEGVDDGMFNIVDGEKADWNVDQGYWAVYEGTEYATTGIDQIVIADGDSFSLVYTIG